MIIWLASYPKSGNTWLRSIICSLIYSKDGKFNFNLLSNIKQFPVASQFENFTKNLTDLNEVKKYWIPSQNLLNLDGKIKFYKTHHINCKIDDYSFTNAKNTLATIYIIRDPRNLVNSIANHYSKSIDEAKEFLLTPRMNVGHNKYDEENKKVLPVLLGKWKEHYYFWKKNNNNFHLIKYEDLILNPEEELEKIVNFLKNFMNIETDLIKNRNILESTSFKNLRSLEEKGEFEENAFENKERKKKFFYLGPKNNWKNLLNENIRQEIENKLSSEMKELGYL